ncbi:MAG: transposase [Candidatus Muiribacteriota bacterium]
MARQLRIEYEGAHYHVFARGERKDTFFLSKQDYEIFIEKLQDMLIKFNVECCAFALMPNHYHLYLITHEANLTKAMHYLNSSYTNWFKIKHEIVGHVFQGRYKAIVVDKDNYFFRVIDYIHLNPVEAKIVKIAWEYPWSSCGFYIGKDRKFHFVNKFNYLSTLSNEIKKAELEYKNIISKSKDKKLPHRDLFKGIALGKKNFKNKIEEFIKKEKENIYVPATVMNKKRDSNFFVSLISKNLNIEEKNFFDKPYKKHCNKILIYFLKKYSRMNNIEIGDLFKIGPSTVSDHFNNVKKILNSDNISSLKKHIRKIETEYRRPDPVI